MAEKKKTETKVDKVEREYIIPLRERCRPVPRYRKTPKAIKCVKEFLVKHMKIRDRDLKKIKLDKYLNEFLWARGIKNPPHKVKVKAVKEGDVVKVELVDYTDKLKFKKARQDKAEKAQVDAKDKKKAEAKTVAESAKKESEETKKESEKTLEEKTEDKKEEKEKKSSVVEAGKERGKAKHKEAKHQTQIKAKQPKHQIRKALEK